MQTRAVLDGGAGVGVAAHAQAGQEGDAGYAGLGEGVRCGGVDA